MLCSLPSTTAICRSHWPADTQGIADKEGVLKITGLKKGFYTLTQDKTTVVTASANEWAEGVAIKQGNSFVQARGVAADDHQEK